MFDFATLFGWIGPLQVELIACIFIILFVITHLTTTDVSARCYYALVQSGWSDYSHGITAWITMIVTYYQKKEYQIMYVVKT